MASIDPSASQKPLEPPSGERLDSWKEIADYLKRDESTVRRWEDEGLPVHRHPHRKKSSVFAYKAEIDRWLNNGHAGPATTVAPAAPTERRRTLWWMVAPLVLLVLAAFGLSVLGVRDRLLARSVAGRITSIAVLPLKNLSGDARQDYFADGMTEALITRLGQVSALHVISHQSVLGYRETTKSLPQIARELNVDALLEGTVLHSGNRVRITANFVQAVPERHLWAESYEFDRQDVLGVQGEVARDVANGIQIKVTPQEQVRLASTRRVDPDAYEEYLLGRAYGLQPTTMGWTRAKEYLDKSIEKDPAYGPAYAALAELYMRSRGSPMRTPSELRLQARRWAEKALTLDDALAEAHNALARASQQEWDWVGAEREYRRAIALNPSYPTARIWYSMFLAAMGRFEESVVEAKRGQQLDPASPFVNTWAGAMYLYGGRTQEGMASLQKALELDPRYTDANIVRARTYITNGAYQQAVAELQHAVMLKKEREPLVLGALAQAYAKAGHREEALKLVAELERIEREVQREYVPPFGLIWAYAGLADRDRAFGALERDYKLGSDRMIWLNVDPLLAPLRSDPRFTDLARRIGLPQR
jgi:TolB-like protein/Flp pilus assembly protein TadD